MTWLPLWVGRPRSRRSPRRSRSTSASALSLSRASDRLAADIARLRVAAASRRSPRHAAPRGAAAGAVPGRGDPPGPRRRRRPRGPERRDDSGRRPVQAGRGAVAHRRTWRSLIRHRATRSRACPARRRDRPHRQPAYPHPALSLELGAVEGARGVGRRALLAGRVPRARIEPKAVAKPSRSPRNDTARRPRQEPPRRDRALRARRGDRRTQRPPRHGQAMKRLARLIFNRWVLIGIGLLAGALLIWWVGPGQSPSATSGPSSPSAVRWIQIAVLFLTPLGRMALEALQGAPRQRRADDGLVRPACAGPSADPIQRPRKWPSSASASKRLWDSFASAASAADKAVAVDPASRARLAAIPLRPAVVRVHRRAGRGQDHRADQFGAALPPC